MMMTGDGRSSSNNKYLFTATQRQEMEHQALIYHYMSQGLPIPSELMLPMRRSYLLDLATTTNPTLAFAPQPSMGWSCYQMGINGRKVAEDPEPGRCRRTDGKKWRCSKEAYTDSKYCERHMHRGKNRSRKPVETISLITTPTLTSLPSSSLHNPSPHLSISQPAKANYHHLMYPYHSSSRPPGSTGLQPIQNSTTNFHLDTASYSADHRDYRHYHGVRDVGEYSFLSPLETERERPSWELRPLLGMSSLTDQSKQSSYDPTKDEEEEEEEEQKQHCFVLGADFKLANPMKLERDEEEDEAHRPLRRFFNESPPHKTTKEYSWMDQGNQSTQLSMSMPIAYHDSPVSSSRYLRNGLELDHFP